MEAYKCFVLQQLACHLYYYKKNKKNKKNKKKKESMEFLVDGILYSFFILVVQSLKFYLNSL